MASNGDRRSGLLTAGGVLTIISGALETIGGLIMVLVGAGVNMWWRLAILPCHRAEWFERHVMPLIPALLVILGVVILVLGIIAIAGGVSALRRRMFGLALAGAICSLPLRLLGILAIIFISVSKKEFGAEK